MKITTVVKNINDQAIYLSWTNVPIEAINYRIQYCKDDVILDNWDTVGVTSNTFYQDVFNYKHSILNHRVVYKIQALNNKDEIIDELIVNSDKMPGEILTTTLNLLKYKAQVALRNTNWADQVYILKRRENGIRCTVPKCYTRDLRTTNNPECSVCYGTGFVGGYYDPIPSFMMVLQENIKKRALNEYSATSYNDVMATFPSFPQINSGDYIIVEGVGRYLVQESSTKGIASIKSPTSLVKLNLLDPKDPIYNYDVQDKISTLTSIEAYEGGIKLTGQRLIPIFGETKLIVWDDASNEYEVYKAPHIKKLTDQEIIFRSTKTFPPSTFKYRLRLNGILFEGVAS